MKISKKILLIIIFIMPFAQGLYFYFELFLASFLAVIGLWLLIQNKNELWVNRWQILFFAGCAVLSLGTVFYGIDSGMAFIGFLKCLSYVFIYLFIQNFVDEDFRQQLIRGFAYSGLLMAFIGIISYLTGFLGDYMLQNGRLGGFIQYPNTFGLFLVVSLIIILSRPLNSWLKFSGGFIISVAIMMTMSRGVIVILIISLIFMLVMKKTKEQLVDSFGVVIGSGIGYLLINLLSGVESSRLNQMFGASEFQTRLLYYLDSITIIKDHPLGLGHLGYYFIQKTYQTGATYGIKYIHSNILQMVLDLGIIGGLAFVAFFIYHLIKTKSYDRLIMVVILIHGAVEFDFQFGFLWVFMILLLLKPNKQLKHDGICLIKVATEVDSLESDLVNNTGVSKKSTQWIWIISLFLIGLLYISASFVTFLQYTNRNRLAISLYPCYTISKIDILRSQENLEKNLDIAENLIGSQPYHITAFAYVRDYYYNNKHYEEALEYANMCMDKEPMKIMHVEIYSQILVNLAYEYVNLGEYDLAIDMINYINEIPKELEIKRLTKTRNFDIKHKVDFKMSESLINDHYQAELLYKWILSQ